MCLPVALPASIQWRLSANRNCSKIGAEMAPSGPRHTGDRKRYALFHGGHVPRQFNEVIREILDWFDKYVGPIKTIPINPTN
jgi:hypothetical protein